MYFLPFVRFNLTILFMYFCAYWRSPPPKIWNPEGQRSLFYSVVNPIRILSGTTDLVNEWMNEKYYDAYSSGSFLSHHTEISPLGAGLVFSVVCNVLSLLLAVGHSYSSCLRFTNINSILKKKRLHFLPVSKEWFKNSEKQT